jgi:polyhydroxyalkanoate synthesis regulator protein
MNIIENDIIMQKNITQENSIFIIFLRQIIEFTYGNRKQFLFISII